MHPWRAAIKRRRTCFRRFSLTVLRGTMTRVRTGRRLSRRRPGVARDEKGRTRMLIERSARRAVAGIVALLAVALSLGDAPPARAAQSYIKAGILTCSVSAGIGLIVASSKRVSCTFAPDFRGPEYYGGRIRKVGIDIGVTGATVIVWVVLSSVEGFPVGALAGTYGGVSAEASLVLGLGANVLVGGSNRAFALQPLSVQGQLGVNIAAGITQLELYAQ
jgi:hypothetical protein